jgi:Glycosyltransferase family 87
VTSLLRFLRREGWPLAVLAVAVPAALVAGIRQDYQAYTRQWARVVAGRDPWIDANGFFTGNAYGPIHNLLALPYRVHPALPRVLLALVYLSAFLWLRRRFGTTPLRRTVLAGALLANGLFWISVVDYGHNDVLCAALALAAVALVEDGRAASGGAALALGVLTKLYPLALVPLLALDGRRIRGRFLAGFLGTLAAGVAATWWTWGSSFLAPFAYAVERRSSLLSVFYFLRGSRSPLRVLSPSPDLDWLSGYLVLASLALLLASHVRWRLSASFSSALAAVMLFAFYKVGHFQFYVTPLLLLVHWYFREAWDEAESPPRLRALAAYVAWFALVPLAFRQMDHFKGAWGEVREWIGLPSFVIQAWLIASLVAWRARASGRASGLC